jgi:hypothetical protein
VPVGLLLSGAELRAGTAYQLRRKSRPARTIHETHARCTVRGAGSDPRAGSGTRAGRGALGARADSAAGVGVGAALPSPEGAGRSASGGIQPSEIIISACHLSTAQPVTVLVNVGDSTCTAVRVGSWPRSSAALCHIGSRWRRNCRGAAQLGAWMLFDRAAVELLIRARGGRFVAAGQPWLRTDDRGITWLDAEVIGWYLHAVSSEERHILALVEALALGKPLEDVGVPTCTPRACHPAGPRAACWGRLIPAHLAIAEPESVGGVVPLGWPPNNADWPVDGEPAYVEIDPNSGSTTMRGGSTSRTVDRSGQGQLELVSDVNANQWFVVTAERIPGNSYRWCPNGKLYKQILGPGLTPKPEEAAVTKVLSPRTTFRWTTSGGRFSSSPREQSRQTSQGGHRSLVTVGTSLKVVVHEDASGDYRRKASQRTAG